VREKGSHDIEEDLAIKARVETKSASTETDRKRVGKGGG